MYIINILEIGNRNAGDQDYIEMNLASFFLNLTTL